MPWCHCPFKNETYTPAGITFHYSWHHWSAMVMSQLMFSFYKVAWGPVYVALFVSFSHGVEDDDSFVFKPNLRFPSLFTSLRSALSRMWILKLLVECRGVRCALFCQDDQKMQNLSDLSMIWNNWLTAIIAILELFLLIARTIHRLPSRPVSKFTPKYRVRLTIVNEGSGVITHWGTFVYL